MDLQRLFLFLIFAFSLVLVWDGWQRYQHPEQYVQHELDTGKAAIKTGEPRPTNSIQMTQGLPAAELHGTKVYVKTDLFSAEINTMGGDITHLELLKHPDATDKNKAFVLFEKGEGTHNYIAQSGLLGKGLPTHNNLFHAEQDHYELAGNVEQIQVRLISNDASDVKTVKLITFHKGSYLIDVAYEIDNQSQVPVSAGSYFQMVRDSVPPVGSTKFLSTFTGPAVYTEETKFEKVSFSDIEKDKASHVTKATDGWVGMLQHYFVSAWLPDTSSTREYFTRKLDGDMYSAGVVLPDAIVQPGKQASISIRLYAGPTESSLNKIAPGLGFTVDYGWLTIVAKPLFWLMSLLYSWTGNWGIAIILLTFLIKLVFFPLSAASYRSMAKMRLVAPKLEKLKEQYADDREQLNRAMMELYKTEKINPLGGCLPVVIQIPVFIALFWSILSSVEMRYAPFFGWITDLSTADPYYILPLIMGASMIIQGRLNPTPPDPIQAKVMQIMPIAFSVVFFFFPAGLVLYSIVNNLLSIAQQWYITRAAEDETKGALAKR